MDPVTFLFLDLDYFYVTIIISSENSLFVPFERHGCSNGIEFTVTLLHNNLPIGFNEKGFVFSAERLCCYSSIYVLF